ncbi:MAG: hypothetical protein WC522_02905 [Candidatus Omnitrophota bacterium]
MIIKKKSIIVALVSSLVLMIVLVLTLVSYVVYLEIKNRELESSYRHLMGELKTR